jgi:hypothetical protein
MGSGFTGCRFSVRRDSESNRSVGYLEIRIVEKMDNKKIIESFLSGRCPICALLRQDEFDGLCHWVGQSDDKDKESEERKRLLASGGFCNYHFWEFQGISTHYGSASIGAELIERLIKVFQTHGFEDLVGAFKERKEYFKAWSLEGYTHCLLCRDIKKKEKRYLKELTVILQDDSYKAKYSESYGLCIPHFIKIVDYIEDGSLIKFLFETGLAQMGKIKADAINLIQKRESPLCWEQTEDEKKSWFRAIEKVVGRNGA